MITRGSCSLWSFTAARAGISVRKMILMGVVLTLFPVLGNAREQAATSAKATAQRLMMRVFCGQNLKAVALFPSPDFETMPVASLSCGENVIVLAHQGDWTKLRTQKGAEGFTPTWFVRAGSGNPPENRKCNRPSPMDNVEQFKRLKAALDSFVDAEKFPTEFQDAARNETEDLAAGAYFLAYLTAENPGREKAEVLMGAVNNQRQMFGNEFSKLSPSEQSALQTWFRKTLVVMSKAFDSGYQDGAKLPCNPK
jgi:hypothetical protein